MCKCSPKEEWPDENFRQPYCGNKGCKPSKEWVRMQEKCPWLWKRILYGPKENDICSALGISPTQYASGWGSGDFSKHFCSEENCAPYHFFKVSSKEN